MRAPRILLSLSLAALGYANAQTNTLTVEIASSRSPSTTVDSAVKHAAVAIARLTDSEKRRLLPNQPTIPLSFPTRVNLTRNGVLVRSRSSRSPGAITLTFDTTAGHTFPTAYQTLLQTIFADVQTELTAKFGPPQTSGSILVSNYDATISDRDAVAGGVYLPDNGSGQQQIQFPVYNSNETAAVNFVHTLLLAYQGTNPYAYDAFEEGLARGVTAMVMRENLIPGLDMTIVESVLTASYDVLGYYDWYNQRALGGPLFIAPNLKAQPISNGTTGGLYLLRYRMSGAAWAKVLTEYPTLARDLNTAVQATPSLSSNVPGLVSTIQTILNTDRPSNPTVEGLSFAEWYRRQFILQTTLTAGRKVLVEPVAELADSTATSPPDFGVFDIEANYFSTDSSGNETLLTATAYPYFLDQTYKRFSPSAQNDVLHIALGYDSVTPNFLAVYNGGQVYRVAVDVPVGDQLARVFVPAGSISTTLNPTVNDVFGTVVGADPQTTSQSNEVRVYVGSDLVFDQVVVNGAFGGRVVSNFASEYAIARTVEVQVWQSSGATNTQLLDRFVDKPVTGTIPDGNEVGLALDLRVNGEGTTPLPLTAGINAIGFSIDPFESSQSTVLAVDPTQLLVARYDGVSGHYDLNPSTEPFMLGHGYFVHVPAVSNPTIVGRKPTNVPTSVALAPGWNLITTPMTGTISTDLIQVLHADDTSTPPTFTAAALEGSLIGNTFFAFNPSPSDPISGLPETGTFTAATNFVAGQAYFVQCLAPEGVSLLFTPSSTTGVKRQITRSASALPAFQLNIGVTGAAGDAANCVLGMSTSASTNRSLNSSLPPSMGGLQIYSSGSQALYKDFRPVASTVQYTLTSTNLRVGKGYSIAFMRGTGLARLVTVTYPTTKSVQRIPENGRYYFVAKSATQSFTVTVQGAK